MLIPIGGFLGAGKTTMLARAARELTARGWSVGAITNDQAEGLVDTANLRALGLRVAEVAGGCFCCKFDALERAATELTDQTRAILAEPVGSCTDLAATVVRPWRRVLGRRVAPLSVLVDAARLSQAVDPSEPGPLPPESAYIVHKQLEEADAIVLTKVDSLSIAERHAAVDSLNAAFPGRVIFETSAITGEGVTEWLDFVLRDTHPGPGERRIDVDYDLYARGEAVLGWLNAQGTVQAVSPASGSALCTTILEGLRHSCADAGAQIAHAKIRLSALDGAAQGHLTSGDSPAYVTGDCTGDARVIVNARAAVEPAVLQTLTEETLSRAGVRISHAACFSPGRPVPTHRL